MKNAKREIFTMMVLMVGFVASIPAYSQKDAFDYGHMDGGKYVNSYFGLEITLPDGWVIQTQEEMKKLTEQGRELVAGDNENMKASLKAAEVNVANLVAAYQYEKGSPVEYNPSILVVAENVSASPGVKTGSDYLFQARRLLMQSQFKYDSVDREFKKVRIGQTDLYKMNAAVQYAGLDIRQVYFATIEKRFCLSFIISFVNDEQKEMLMKAVNSLSIRK